MFYVLEWFRKHWEDPDESLLLGVFDSLDLAKEAAEIDYHRKDRPYAGRGALLWFHDIDPPTDYLFYAEGYYAGDGDYYIYEFALNTLIERGDE